jgi:elongation factor 1-beta
LKALKGLPDPAKYPHTYRWARHITSFKDEHAQLPGDPSKSYSAYGPAAGVAAAAVGAGAAAAAADDDDEDVDLFGSDDEEEDAEAVKIREERLAEYNKKKAGKTKPAAKSIVT